jgi:hypothetical protein
MNSPVVVTDRRPSIMLLVPWGTAIAATRCEEADQDRPTWPFRKMEDPFMSARAVEKRSSEMAESVDASAGARDDIDIRAAVAMIGGTAVISALLYEASEYDVWSDATKEP